MFFILFLVDLDSFAMMVDLPFLIIPESVHVGVEENNDKGEEEVEEKPHINHLHVGGLGQVVAHVDKHGRQHQHRGQIHSDNSLKSVIICIIIKINTCSPRKKRL